jgi:hypothetical protein
MDQVVKFARGLGEILTDGLYSACGGEASFFIVFASFEIFFEMARKKR